jgi:hypothetical protein
MKPITIDRAVIQQALEALESLFTLQVDYARPKQCGDAITALRAALEQPEQEPVAWMHRHIEGNVITHRPADLDRHPDRWTFLYKNPTPCETCQALARTVMMDQMGAA